MRLMQDVAAYHFRDAAEKRVSKSYSHGHTYLQAVEEGLVADLNFGTVAIVAGQFTEVCCFPFEENLERVLAESTRAIVYLAMETILATPASNTFQNCSLGHQLQHRPPPASRNRSCSRERTSVCA